MEQIDDCPGTALRWHREGIGAVLATVVQTWGSAPRRVGAQLVVSGDGQMQGSVSGGCVEGAVLVEAQEALETGDMRMLEYGVSDGDAFAVGLACGGTIRVLLEPVGLALPQDLLEQIVTARKDRVAVAYEVDIKTGDRHVRTNGHKTRFRMDRSGLEEGGNLFVAIHNPPLRLIIVGAVHVAQALVPMARIAGYDPVIIDPRGAFGSEARFPGEKIVAEWPDDAIATIGLDARTAVVLLTHDPKLDDPALHAALASEVFYIGALGSGRTHAARRARLSDAGFDAAQIDRIHGPIGLDIKAAGPAEIAVSIMAEMVQTLRVDA